MAAAVGAGWLLFSSTLQKKKLGCTQSLASQSGAGTPDGAGLGALASTRWTLPSLLLHSLPLCSPSTCVHVHVYMYLCACVHEHVHMRMCACVHVQVGLCACVHVDMQVCACVCVLVHMHVCMHASMYM